MRIDLIYCNSWDWDHQCCECGQSFGEGTAIDYDEYCLWCGDQLKQAIAAAEESTQH
jgi:rRNA maturation endonuclease Nob1